MKRVARIDNNGVELAMADEGDGPDLLFVHGLGSAQVLWHSFVEDLRDRYRCWNLDLRGHGASGRAPEAYSPSFYGSDVAAALNHIGRPTIGIGHSLGGMAVVRVGAEGHPLLRAVYAIDSPVLRLPGEQSTMGAIFERQLAMLREFQPQNRPVDDYEAVLAAAPYVGGGTNGERFLPAQLRGRAESLSQLDPECLEALLNGSMAVEPLSPALSIPFRMVAADPELDAVFRPEHHEALRAESPHVEIETMQRVGHQMMMIEGFDTLVRDDLERFLAAVVPPHDEVA